MIKKYHLKVTSSEHGMKLLSFLREKCLDASSVKALKRAIDGKNCFINGKVEFFSTHQLSQGDLIELSLKEEKKVAHSPEILFEDEHLLILNKPAFVVSDPKDLRLPFQLVHRLDKDTSGALILAKNETSAQAIMQLFFKRSINKFYLGIVDGNIEGQQGKIDYFLTKKYQYDGGSIYGKGNRSNGKKALTFWKCLRRGKSSSFLLIQPVSGRTHQIRAHLKEIGHPILGDWQYCQKFSCPFHVQRQMLHSFCLEFVHPIHKKLLKVTAPLPNDFIANLKSLGIDYEPSQDELLSTCIESKERCE